MSRIKASVIVPHYQDLANLDSCLAALEQQTCPRDEFEVVVADNASPCGTDAVERAINGRARLAVVHERGAGPARNGGVAASEGAILAFIDSDCIASRHWLAEGIEALSKFDFVGGQVDVSVASESRISPTEAFERVFAFDFDRYINRKGFTGSGNLFVTRKVFEAVGGFRDRVSEDVDWSRRAVSLGFRLGYAPAAAVSHPARRNWPELRAKWKRINRETYALYTAGSRGRAKWLARTLLLPASALAHSPRVLTSRKLRSLRERIGALGILYRCRMWRFADAMKIAVSK